VNGDDGTDSDRGAGLVATIAGLLVFLALLLFAVQSVIGMYATSLATDAAYEGARLVAGARTDHDTSPAPIEARAAADAMVRQQLGSFGDDVELDWSATTWDEVALTIRARTPSFLWNALRGEGGRIDRTVRVRVERFQ
jgi:Flp pilus assembly protein TadG